MGGGLSSSGVVDCWQHGFKALSTPFNKSIVPKLYWCINQSMSKKRARNCGPSPTISLICLLLALMPPPASVVLYNIRIESPPKGAENHGQPTEDVC